MYARSVYPKYLDHLATHGPLEVSSDTFFVLFGVKIRMVSQSC